MEHRFGGNWTEIKLARLRSYLQAYRRIFRQNERARFLRTWFVDAFAGTGDRSDQGQRIEQDERFEPTLFDDVYSDIDTSSYRDGSARIALGLDDPFDYYLFIEKSARRLSVLKNNLTEAYPDRLPRCSFQPGDANQVLQWWSRQRNWKKERAVVFLDPYGMQVDWKTIEVLAATKGVDLWYLFPLGVGVSRLLARHGNIEDSWQARLDALFGTNEWRDKF